MYKIKQVPEDFVVKEQMHLNLDDAGKYAYYILRKRQYSTFDAISAVARKIGIRPNFINAAGLKDKQAVTEQYISIRGGPQKDLALKDISLVYIGQGRDRINVGSLDGNQFTITVRDISGNETVSDIRFVPNYFDKQRFGKGNDNHIIGRLIVKKQFRDVVDILISKGNHEVKEHLEKKENDHVGALRKIQKRILQFYVLAYQSYLWNDMVSKYITGIKKDQLPDDEKRALEFPLPGFNVELSGEKKEIMDAVLQKEGIALRDFILRQIPGLSADGYPRKVFAEIHGLKIGKFEDDELNCNRKKIIIKFYLEKGSYATNVIRLMFSKSDIL